MSDSSKIQKFGGTSSPLISRLAIAKLSEDIIQSAAHRKAFVANPDLFVKEKYGSAIDEVDNGYVERLRQMVADGFCCGGCFCYSADHTDQVVNPAIMG